MGRRFPNPIRLAILWIGLALAKLGLIEAERARRTTDLAWPRIVTGLARMSKNAVDVAMVGIGVGSAAIAGVGFASPFWGLAFAFGGGVAGGTIALVSQRYGADAFGQLGQAVRSSALLVVIVTLPITATFWYFPAELISLLSSDPEAIELGAEYLKIVGLGIPFAGLNLIGSRTFVGMDDAWTPMVVRAGGAVANIVINALLIFGLGMGVAGAAIGTVLANVVVSATFAIGLVAGRLPGAGQFPVSVDPVGSYLHASTIRDLTTIGLPVLGSKLVWTVAEFPLLAIVDVFGQDTVSAYVIARRIWGLMNTPGWGFGLAASSLVGQELGTGDERRAERFGMEIVLFATAVYAVGAVIVFAFAEPIVLLFTDDPAELAVGTTVALVQVACFAILLKGVATGADGALKASGDTRWPFYSQLLGMFGLAIPLTYLGAIGFTIPSTTVPLLGVTVPGVSIAPIGLLGLYLAFLAETAVPAVINYYRFWTGRWKAISRGYRPDAVASDD
ncbi:MATE family efflux transporter [Natronobacterium texcoconense]|uniref:Multidrug-efflux transporter n=1 Tax=Natronobacterium texcoconense TaxID=1095778 RepID=A0A1H1F931_NATTX|nr:MATE family efflux transporter [Natronobacterium texcoconense]SDQ97279.1 putative efflux protein, MATE family [Natronobacterium texcoconense]